MTRKSEGVGYPSVDELMNTHGVSRRTILRDIEFLRDRYDAPREYDTERKGYFYSGPTFMIRNVLLTEGELFTVPEDFDVGRHIDLSFGIWNNPEPPTEYELLFCPATANYISEREWHKDQSITRNKDGSVTICFKSNQKQVVRSLFLLWVSSCWRFKSNQKQVVRSWVLGFGSAVRVLRPKELADSVREEALKVAAMYGDC